MAIAFDAVSSNVQAGLTPPSVSHTATGSDLYAVIVVGHVSNNTTTPETVSCTYDGNACTKVDSAGLTLGTNRYLHVDLFIYADPPTGAATVAASYAAGGAATLSGSLHVATYTGVSIHNNHDGATGTDTSPTVSITTAVDNAYVVGGIVASEQADDTSIAAGAGITERAEDEAEGTNAGDDHNLNLQDKAVASAGATTFNGTIDASEQWGIVGVELQPVIEAAIAFDAVSSDTVTGGVGPSVSHTATGSDLYAVIGVAHVNNQTNNGKTVTVTYGGSTCTKLETHGLSLGTSRYLQLDLFIYADPPAGAADVVVTYGGVGGALSGSLVVATYTGIEFHTAVHDGDTGTDTTPTVDVTTTADDAILVGFIAASEQADNSSITAGADSTERTEVEAEGAYTGDDHNLAALDEEVAAPALTTFDGVIDSSDQWCIAVVELKPVVVLGGGGQAPRSMHQFALRR